MELLAREGSELLRNNQVLGQEPSGSKEKELKFEMWLSDQIIWLLIEHRGIEKNAVWHLRLRSWIRCWYWQWLRVSNWEGRRRDGGTQRKNQEKIVNIRVYWPSVTKQQGIKSSVKRAMWTRGLIKGDGMVWGEWLQSISCFQWQRMKRWLTCRWEKHWWLTLEVQAKEQSSSQIPWWVCRINITCSIPWEVRILLTFRDKDNTDYWEREFRIMLRIWTNAGYWDREGWSQQCATLSMAMYDVRSLNL